MQARSRSSQNKQAAHGPDLFSLPLACVQIAASPAVTLAGDDGVIRVTRAHPIADRS
jgi:hypothetical protein